jgi:hypothetical protein
MRLFLALVFALVFCAAPSAHATGASCNVTPNPLHVLQQGTLSATALPTDVTVALYTYFTYNGHTDSYGDVVITPNPDGSYSQSVEWDLSGKVTYKFVNDVTSALLASCTDRVQ